MRKLLRHSLIASAEAFDDRSLLRRIIKNCDGGKCWALSKNRNVDCAAPNTANRCQRVRQPHDLNDGSLVLSGSDSILLWKRQFEVILPILILSQRYKNWNTLYQDAMHLSTLRCRKLLHPDFRQFALSERILPHFSHLCAALELRLRRHLTLTMDTYHWVRQALPKSNSRYGQRITAVWTTSFRHGACDIRQCRVRRRLHSTIRCPRLVGT